MISHSHAIDGLTQTSDRDLPILVADDDCGVCQLMQESLTGAGFPVACVHSGAEIMAWLADRRTRLLLLDVRLPDMDGASVLEGLSRVGQPPPFLIISGLCDTKVAVDYMRRGARDYLIKDANFLELVPAVVRRVLHDFDRDEQLTRLQREILEIAEREQRRIGQDIHDDLCQRLAAIKMKLQHLGEEVQKAAPALADEAAALSHHLGEATCVARALARGLSPVDIGHDGLPAALLGLARTAEEIFRIKCRLQFEGTCPALDHHAATQLYRITQECIANAVKHAAATEVTINLQCGGEPIVLTITNNGRPFPRPPGQTGLGLHLMRHRAESIKAALEFIHQPPNGITAVRITLPHHEKGPQNPTESANNKLRIAIIEDHTLMREGLAQLVSSQPDMTVAVEAGDAADGLTGILQTRPDLALIDITLPGRNGLELVKDIVAQMPQLPILVISMHDETLYAERALKAGAKGYLMKDAERSTIIAAIRRILSGGFYVSDKMAGEIFASFAGKHTTKTTETGGAVSRLSDREFEVFEHLGGGLSTNEIAERLGISPKTVEVHRARIREKLDLQNGAALVRYAVRWVETRNLGAPSER